MLRIDAAQEILPGRLRKTHPNKQTQTASAAPADEKPRDRWAKARLLPAPWSRHGELWRAEILLYLCSRAHFVALDGFINIVCPGLCSRLVQHSLLLVPREHQLLLGEEGTGNLPSFLPSQFQTSI